MSNQQDKLSFLIPDQHVSAYIINDFLAIHDDTRNQALMKFPRLDGLLDELHLLIMDPLSESAKKMYHHEFRKSYNLASMNYHLWKLDIQLVAWNIVRQNSVMKNSEITAEAIQTQYYSKFVNYLDSVLTKRVNWAEFWKTIEKIQLPSKDGQIKLNIQKNSSISSNPEDWEHVYQFIIEKYAIYFDSKKLFLGQVANLIHTGNIFQDEAGHMPVLQKEPAQLSNSTETLPMAPVDVGFSAIIKEDSHISASKVDNTDKLIRNFPQEIRDGPLKGLARCTQELLNMENPGLINTKEMHRKYSSQLKTFCLKFHRTNQANRFYIGLYAIGYYTILKTLATQTKEIMSVRDIDYILAAFFDNKQLNDKFYATYFWKFLGRILELLKGITSNKKTNWKKSAQKIVAEILPIDKALNAHDWDITNIYDDMSPVISGKINFEKYNRQVLTLSDEYVTTKIDQTKNSFNWFVDSKYCRELLEDELTRQPEGGWLTQLRGVLSGFF